MGLKQRSKEFFRGWFPQEPMLPRGFTSNSSNLEGNTLPTEKEFTSLRLQHKKIYIPVAAFFLSSMMLCLYLLINRLIDEELAFAGLMTILIGLLYNGLALDVYIKRKTALRATIDKMVLPVITSATLAIAGLWILASANLVSFKDIAFPILIIGFSVYAYHFIVDSSAKSKIRQQKRAELRL